MWRTSVIIQMKDGGNPVPVIQDFQYYHDGGMWAERAVLLVDNSNMKVLEVAHRFHLEPEGGESEEIKAPF